MLDMQNYVQLNWLLFTIKDKIGNSQPVVVLDMKYGFSDKYL